MRVNEEKGTSIGHDRDLPRAFVADLIRLGKASFQTRIRSEDGKYRVGAAVHLIDDEYLTTNRNSTERDNLENLPEFYAFDRSFGTSHPYSFTWGDSNAQHLIVKYRYGADPSPTAMRR